MEEIASARRFSAARAVVQIYGTCDDCRTGKKTAPIDGATTELVFARDALRMAIATERSGLEFYTRAATLTKDQRGRAVFQELAAEEGHHLGVLEQRYRELTAKDPQLESRPTFLFFKGAASGLFDAGTEQLRGGGVDDARALLIGIKCERGSHKFFKRYGERFEDSEGKQVFLEFADEERAHLDLLIREYRSLRQRQGRRRMRRGGREKQAEPSQPNPHAVDRSSHAHDRVRRPRARPASWSRRAAAAGVTVLAVTDHDTIARMRGGRRRLRRRRRDVRAGDRNHRDARRSRRPRPRLFHRRAPRRRFTTFLAEQRRQRIDRLRQMVGKLATLGIRAGCRGDSAAGRSTIPGSPPAGRGSPAPSWPADTSRARTKPSIDGWCAGKPAFVPRLGASPAEVIARIHEASGLASLAHPALVGHDEWIGEPRRPTASMRSRRTIASTTAWRRRGISRWPRRWESAVSGGSDFHGDPSHGPSHPGAVSLPRE